MQTHRTTSGSSRSSTSNSSRSSSSSAGTCIPPLHHTIRPFPPSPFPSLSFPTVVTSTEPPSTIKQAGREDGDDHGHARAHLLQGLQPLLLAPRAVVRPRKSSIRSIDTCLQARRHAGRTTRPRFYPFILSMINRPLPPASTDQHPIPPTTLDRRSWRPPASASTAWAPFWWCTHPSARAWAG